MNIRIYLLKIFFIYNAVCESQDECYYYTCGECISNLNCVWCAQDVMAAWDRRCIPISTLNNKQNWCLNNFIRNPQPEMVVTVDKPFNETIENVTVQFRPQHIRIKTRPGVTIPIKMSYKPAEDFPLDVYYLMDVSYTMKSVNEHLKNQALEIHKQLMEYTNNVKLGIGSFVEKPAFPYVDKNKKHTQYSFKNELSLTKDMNEFRSKLTEIRYGANYDNPEAGLDALMQAMTCENELGWRKGARRIIVLCTDSTYHSAGDGKVLGVIRPNDMQCHLEDNLYHDKMALTYDYPSISQINKIAREGHFIIIFAAKKLVATEYTMLARHILGAKYAVLERKEDAVDIIKKAYAEASTTIKLNYELPQFIQLTLDQNCQMKPTRNCESTPEQRTVTIEGNLTVKYCPTDGNLERELQIKAIGINDKLTIKLEIDCKCDCEATDSGISPKCNNAGAIQCGICKCSPGSYGVDCHCNGTSTDIKDIEKCKLNYDDTKLCSGRGTCVCGRCEKCKEGFSGEFCQFDDNSCPRKCSNNGICQFGKCNCDKQWSGVDCGCSLNIDTCIAPFSKELCSGNGVCECGKCQCKILGESNETYSATFCDDYADFAEERCKELEEYVVCNVMQEKQLCNEKYNATDFSVEFINRAEFYGPKWSMAKWCDRLLENGSYIIFKYQYEHGSIKFAIQDEVEVLLKAHIIIAVGSVLGTVLLAGILALILWKISVDLLDKREFKKFSKEYQAAGFDVSLNRSHTPSVVNSSNQCMRINRWSQELSETNHDNYARR